MTCRTRLSLLNFLNLKKINFRRESKNIELQNYLNFIDKDVEVTLSPEYDQLVFVFAKFFSKVAPSFMAILYGVERLAESRSYILILS